MQKFGSRVMFYLAAAVSDFYVPWPDLPEHKIQSRGGALNLQLQQVPKCLGLLRNEWAPDAFHVSFKLETDEELLLKKAKAAITNYGMHCVVANELHTRTERCESPVIHRTVGWGPSCDATRLCIELSLCYCCYRVHLVARSGASSGDKDWQVDVLDRGQDRYIEEKLVSALMALHLGQCQQ